MQMQKLYSDEHCCKKRTWLVKKIWLYQKRLSGILMRPVKDQNTDYNASRPSIFPFASPGKKAYKNSVGGKGFRGVGRGWRLVLSWLQGPRSRAEPSIGGGVGWASQKFQDKLSLFQQKRRRKKIYLFILNHERNVQGRTDFRAQIENSRLWSKFHMPRTMIRFLCQEKILK